MQDVRVTIRLLAPLGTPWHSDTVFGHLCLHIAQADRAMGVEEFLRPFREGRPPFVLSDGFPGPLLPRPLVPLPEGESASPDEYATMKERRRSLFVSETDFQALRRGEAVAWTPVADPWMRFEQAHAAISRLTGTTGGGDDGDGGHLFQRELLTLTEGDELTLYVRAEGVWSERVPELLTQMAPLGFGKHRSTGAGAFEVTGVEPHEGFAPLPEANGFISLSSYCPAHGDPTVGRWRLRLKHGKLGEGGNPANVFKRPLILFEPGAVFATGGPPHPHYGRLIPAIAPGMPEAVQGCFALAVPCVIPPGVVDDLHP